MMKKVLEYQRQLRLIEDGDRIVVGFSGGADSVCLLLVMEELKKYYDISFCGVHVEHGIRGEESLKDAEFAKTFCNKRQIPFFVYHVDAPAKAANEGCSLEEAARDLRYQCFAAAREAFGGNKVAVAHHGDDNAETMLFHLIRGTGIRGMAGISPKRGEIIRPLLCVTREEIEAYIKDAGADYCTDSTNADITYSRNRIRNCVLPELRKINPRATEHMTSLSRQVTSLYEYVSREAWRAGKDGLANARDGEVSLHKAHVAAMDPVLQREFLHQVLGIAAGSKKDIGEIHVEELTRLFYSNTGKMCNLPYGLLATVGYDQVVISKYMGNEDHKEDGIIGEKTSREMISLDDILSQSVTLSEGLTISAKILDFDGDCEKIPEKTYTKWFDYDRINGTVFLRKRRIGDYLIINQQGNQKKLKEYFIHEKIPRQLREQIWLLAEDAHIIWAIGHRISEGYKVTSKTKRILEVQVEKEN